MSDLYWLGTVVRNGDRLVYGTDMTQPLQSYVGMQLYAKTYVNNAYTYVDVSRMLTLIPKVDMTQTLGKFLSSLNTLTVLNYLDPTIPLPDASSGLFMHRITSADPFAGEGWSVDYTSIVVPDVVSDPYRITMCDDLRISAPKGVDPNCLIPFVNGVFHQSVVYNNSLYALDGFANIRMTDKKQVLVLDTSTVGGHSFLPFTDDMIISPDSDIANGCIVRLPDGTLTGKTTLLVIDGYVYWDAKYFRRLTDGAIKVNTNLINWPYQFAKHPLTKYSDDGFGDWSLWQNPFFQQESPVVIPTNPKKYPSKSTDPYLTSFLGNAGVDRATFMTPAFIRSRFTQANSGVILINHPMLFRSELDLVVDYPPVQYVAQTFDTPHGILSYGPGYIYPYSCLYGMNGRHRVFIADPDIYDDLYMTVPGGYVPNRNCQTTDNTKSRAAKLTNFYGADPSLLR